MSEARKYYGKYRGLVVNNNDLSGRGRLLALVPEVTGSAPTIWAEPCFPFGGPGCGLIAVPTAGASVWIEYEKGDINAPIWTGCFFPTASEVPLRAPKPLPFASITLQLPGGAHLVISDDPTLGITLGTLEGAKIQITKTGITIDNGKGAAIEMTANSIDINKGALRIT